MKYFTKITDYDVADLARQLRDHPDLWNAHALRKTAVGSPHSRMNDIWVRYNDVAPFRESGDYSTFNDPHVPIWYPAWKLLPALRPIIFDLMTLVEGEMLGGVLITRIPPGQGIAKHIDKGWHVAYYSKYYLSIQSSPGAEFHCADEVLTPVTGEVYLFDNKLEHWVENKSNVDRITLIVCIRANKEGKCVR